MTHSSAHYLVISDSCFRDNGVTTWPFSHVTSSVTLPFDSP